jgi:maltose/moltooligosaccharide transporter
MAGEPNSKLSWGERRFLALLGLPTFALSLSVTIVASFVPVLIEDEGPAVTGALIGMEGLFALTLPIVLGSISDRIDTRFGSRMPFAMAAAPVGAIALIALPFTDSIAVTAAALAVYFASYYVYFTPYSAMYPDLVPQRARGRSQAFMNMWRQLGLGGALVGGNLLIAVWQPLPFTFAAAILLVSTALFLWFMLRRRDHEQGEAEEREPEPPTAGEGEGEDDDGPGPVEQLRSHLGLLRSDRALAWILTANALWEVALNALRTFVVLYIVVGLDRSFSFASLVLALVGIAVALAAPLSGTLADRWGHSGVLLIGLAFYGPGLLLPLVTVDAWAFPLFALVALGAGAVMALPYSLVMGRFSGGEHHGAAAGLFGLSRGVGLLAGPALAGTAVTLLEPLFEDTQGYGAIFPVASIAVTASIPIIWHLRRHHAT